MFHKNTNFTFILYKLLGGPLEGLFYLLAFILYKDLNASAFQITVLIVSRPAVALLSFYGNLFIKNKPSQLKRMIMLCSVLGSIPCFFMPFVTNVWFMIFANGLFNFTLRAVLPAWGEIFKINLESPVRSKIFSKGSMVNYSANIVFPLMVSPLLDSYPSIWKWLFFLFAAVNCLNVLLMLNLKLRSCAVEGDEYHPYQLSFKSVVLDPWKNGWHLIKTRVDFRNYQIVFMISAAGLMLMQPVLPIFFKETLNLTYLQLTLATSLCKGASFVATSPYWAHWMNKISINLFNFFVCGFAAIFSLFIIESQYVLFSLYVAYLIYGTMQAGSELSWNLSGPIFAESKDSTLYTGVNVAAVGIRGCIAPFLGEMLLLNTGSTTVVFMCGGSLCLMGSLYSLWVHLKSKVAIAKAESLT